MQLRVYINGRDMKKSRRILQKKPVLKSDGPMPTIEPNFDKNREKLTAPPRGQWRLRREEAMEWPETSEWEEVAASSLDQSNQIIARWQHLITKVQMQQDKIQLMTDKCLRKPQSLRMMVRAAVLDN